MKHELEFFPDGTPIDDWFYEIETRNFLHWVSPIG